MTRIAKIENAFLASVLSVMAALALLLVAAPAAAAPKDNAVKKRAAELCTASDTDLVGKRMARECRKQVRAEAERPAKGSEQRDTKLAGR